MRAEPVNFTRTAILRSRPTQTRRSLAGTATLLAGCGASVNDNTGGNASGSGEIAQPIAPGVTAPIMLNETKRSAVVRFCEDSVVFALEDPTSWTATLAPASAGVFLPGADADGYVTNPAVELTRPGNVTVTLTNSTSRSVVFELTVVSPVSEFESISRVAAEFAENLVGLIETEAIRQISENGLSFRIASRDGEFFALTQDYSPGRINLEIVDGVITGALIG
jgi:hypothetical protein